MIHQYQLLGYNIVLDVCSGSVHAVDQVAYDLIALFEGRSREEVLSAMVQKHPELTEAELSECYDQVDALARSGKLFTPDTFAPLPDIWRLTSQGHPEQLTRFGYRDFKMRLGREKE